VLEEIVGEIDDEHDAEDADKAFIRPQGDAFIVKALTPVEDFNRYFQAELSSERADTIGGLVMMELGRLPKGGESVDLGQFHFQVLRADNRRIHLLEMTLRNGEQTTPSTTESEV
jgi:magnesium and cobalt transporter